MISFLRIERRRSYRCFRCSVSIKRFFVLSPRSFFNVVKLRGFFVAFKRLAGFARLQKAEAVIIEDVDLWRE